MLPYIMGKFITNQEIIALHELVNANEISEQDLEDAIIVGSPVLWAESKLRDPDNPEKTLELRSYQTEVLVDRPTIALRWGRQIGKSVVLTVRILWELFTEKNVRILFFAPRKKHINDIFTYIEAMISASPELRNELLLKKDAKSKKALDNPEDAIPNIETKGGSKALFFHTQSKTAREQIRGTRGGKVFMDEAHYIDEEMIGALSGIIGSAKDVFIWAQSTPRGPKGWFFDFTQTASLHSHHTSQESPLWDDTREAAARLMAPDDGTYRREYLAEFISDGWNAFSDASLDLAQNGAVHDTGLIEFQGKNYLNSEQIKAIPGDIYIGVDWNIANNGTKITIFKHSLTGVVYYQDIHSIEHPQYTQLKSIDRLFELINEYDPKGIAIDEGYAAGQVELISAKMEEPKYQYLRNRLEVVKFGELIYIPTREFFGIGHQDAYVNDPEDNQEEFTKMPMKVFMVSVMTRLMLKNQLIISPLDSIKERKTLLQELRSVEVVKLQSVNNYPVYSKKNNHKFASSMLAIYTYFLHNGGYAIVKDTDNKLYLRKSRHMPSDKLMNTLTLWSNTPFNVASVALSNMHITRRTNSSRNPAVTFKNNLIKEIAHESGSKQGVIGAFGTSSTKQSNGFLSNFANRRNNRNNRRGI